jgi:hypothetical protein
MWDLWGAKWHWDRFFPEYFGFPLSISFHRCSIIPKNKKKTLIIFIAGLHNKPQGCGASVASAGRRFKKEKETLNTTEVVLYLVLEGKPCSKTKKRCFQNYSIYC